MSYQIMLKQKKRKGRQYINMGFRKWIDLSGSNGYHVGVLYEGRIYCNIHPEGLIQTLCIEDFVIDYTNQKFPPIYVYF